MPRLTPDMIKKLKKWLDANETDANIARWLKVSEPTIRNHRIKMGYPPSPGTRPKPKPRPKKEKPKEPTIYYTITRNRGGEVVAKGTAEECAKALMSSPDWIRQMAIKSRRNKLKHFTVKTTF
jgi:hypothetical protein